MIKVSDPNYKKTNPHEDLRVEKMYREDKRAKLRDLCAANLKAAKKAERTLKSSRKFDSPLSVVLKKAAHFKCTPLVSIKNYQTILNELNEELKSKKCLNSINGEYVSNLEIIFDSVNRRLNTLINFHEGNKILINDDTEKFLLHMIFSLAYSINQIRAFLYGSILFTDGEINLGAKYKCAVREAEVFWQSKFRNKFSVGLEEFKTEFITKGPASKTTLPKRASSESIMEVVNLAGHSSYVSKFDFDRFTIMFRPFHAIGEILNVFITMPMGFCNDDSIETDFSTYGIYTVGSYMISAPFNEALVYWMISIYSVSHRWVSGFVSPFRNIIEYVINLDKDTFKYPKGAKLSKMVKKTLYSYNIAEMKLNNTTELCEICEHQIVSTRLEPCEHFICDDCAKILDENSYFKCLNCFKFIVSTTKISADSKKLREPNTGNCLKKLETSKRKDSILKLTTPLSVKLQSENENFAQTLSDVKSALLEIPLPTNGNPKSSSLELSNGDCRQLKDGRKKTTSSDTIFSHEDFRNTFKLKRN